MRDYVSHLKDGPEDDNAVKLVESRIKIVWSKRVHTDHLHVFVFAFVFVFEFVFVCVFGFVLYLSFFVNISIRITISKMKEDRKISSA